MKLCRQRLLLHGRVHAIAERLQRCTRARLQMSPLGIHDAIDGRNARVLVRRQRGRPHHFGEPSEHEAADQIHLKQAVRAFGIPLREVQIVIVLRDDVRNVARIAGYRDRRNEPRCAHNTAGLRGRAHSGASVDRVRRNRRQ